MALRVLYFTFYIQQLDLQNLDKFCLTDSETNLAAGKFLVSLWVILGFLFLALRVFKVKTVCFSSKQYYFYKK